MSDTFTTIDRKPVLWTDKRGVTHRCAGGDLHPGVRLIWTACEIDVPAGAAHVLSDGSAPVDCPDCLAAA